MTYDWNQDPASRRRKPDEDSDANNQPQPDSAPRQRSAHDPDVLHEIVKQSRGISQNDVQRITHTQIRTLRETGEIESGVIVSLCRSFQSFFGGLLSGLGSMFHRQEKQSRQCDIYGHVVEERWTGDFPRCIQCGSEVTSQDQLRKSSPKNK